MRRIKYMDCMLLLCCYVIAKLMRFCGRVESTGELGLDSLPRHSRSMIDLINWIDTKGGAGVFLGSSHPL